jgi:hypothetical protein
MRYRPTTKYLLQNNKLLNHILFISVSHGHDLFELEKNTKQVLYDSLSYHSHSKFNIMLRSLCENEIQPNQQVKLIFKFFANEKKFAHVQFQQ